MLELIVRRGRTLIDTSSLGPSDALTQDDEQRLRAFAASAATAVALAQSVESDRLRSLLAAADAERSRWARELHDETLQGLGALHLLLAAARRRGDARQTELAVDEAIEHIQQEIENLHAIITDLRPAALDQLGLRPALEALVEAAAATARWPSTPSSPCPTRPTATSGSRAEVESTIYRLVQERHQRGQARPRAPRLGDDPVAAGIASIEVRDDGVGFATDVARHRLRAGEHARARHAGRRDDDDRLRRAGTLLRAQRARTARGAARIAAAGARRSAASRPATRRLTYSSPRAALSTAGVSSASASCLTTKPIAPAPSAAWAKTVLSSIVSTTICVPATCRRSRRIASRLVPLDMLRSITSTPGRPSWTRARPRQVVGLGDHLDAGLAVQQAPQPATDQRRGRRPGRRGSALRWTPPPR